MTEANKINLYTCDFCKLVSKCDWHYETNGKPCVQFEQIPIRKSAPGIGGDWM